MGIKGRKVAKRFKRSFFSLWGVSRKKIAIDERTLSALHLLKIEMKAKSIDAVIARLVDFYAEKGSLSQGARMMIKGSGTATREEAAAPQPSEVATSRAYETAKPQAYGDATPQPREVASQPVAQASATSSTAATTGEAPSQPPLTEKQLSHILELLGRNRWSWLDIKDVVEWELGDQLPDDPANLTKAQASRIIDLLRAWEKKPSKEEISEARKVLQQLPEDYAKQFNFPESVSQVRKYHISLARYALAKLQKQVKEEQQKAATKS